MKKITGGWYYCASLEGEALPVLCDKSVIFEQESSLIHPLVFEMGVRRITAELA